jgi:ribose 5-phosphate isomerase A
LASAADADVVDLFDAAKLTVSDAPPLVISRRACEYYMFPHSLQVDKFVSSGMVVGLGSGPASALAIQYLGTRLRRGSLTGISAVTS